MAPGPASWRGAQVIPCLLEDDGLGWPLRCRRGQQGWPGWWPQRASVTPVVSELTSEASFWNSPLTLACWLSA